MIRLRSNKRQNAVAAATKIAHGARFCARRLRSIFFFRTTRLRAFYYHYAARRMRATILDDAAFYALQLVLFQRAPFLASLAVVAHVVVISINSRPSKSKCPPLKMHNAEVNGDLANRKRARAFARFQSSSRRETFRTQRDADDPTVREEWRVKVGLAEMLKGGVIMDVMNAEQARIAEAAGAVAVMALERIPALIRQDGGVARMSDPQMIREVSGRLQAVQRMQAGDAF